ncbi:transcription factor Adf-1-like [Onychostoma macrolepis]|uniref:Transcription factor Adf-1 n=1 Tax=Onychostoma macrolepis TaxID=369639 RepID=A0A7J6C0J6_9TELE|nr:transcription factor Adf-1-like [Onychostoma macrolepis]KAF4100125.1 hypothetical protein G5714_018321 [Onychostoma macrolepis]
MEEKLIITVANQPVLYDQSLYMYLDAYRRDQAWKEVAEAVGESEEICRTRWKSLRDRFRKERNKEREMRRSGAGSSATQPWRFMAVMGFLTPFLTNRETSSNIPRRALPPSPTTSSVHQFSISPEPEEDSQVRERSQVFSQQAHPSRATVDEAAIDTGSQMEAGRETELGRQMEQEEPVEVADRGRKRKRQHVSVFEKGLLAAIEPLTPLTTLSRPPPPPAPEDEDEMFFRSLLPSVHRLSVSRRARLRFEIHKLIFQAEQEAAEGLP